jgi:metal-responsive CopG/Arc/MetJ family transcriptional regulator
MPAKPVQISIDEDLLAQVDADSETKRDGRSAFMRSAILRYLAAKRRRAVDAAIVRAYRGKSAAAMGDDSDLIEAQEWPDD